MKILVTAFDPFGGEKTNPALEAVKALPSTIAGADIVKLEVPTVFGTSLAVVEAAMARELPDAVVSVGQAGGRFGITPERIAINLSDAPLEDNAGKAPVDEAVAAGGPAAYFSTLPVKAMVKALVDAGIPASLSNSAGTFVCNQLMYGVLHRVSRSHPGMLAGFIHVPCIPEQVVNKPNTPSMALADIVRGLTICLEAVRAAKHS